MRRVHIGAEISPRGVDFRVWAPRRRKVEVVIDGAGTALDREDGGYFAGQVAGARAGTRYGYRLDGEDKLYPDPASRFQPDGPHGSSLVIDPSRFEWSDKAWRGVSLPGQVIYEMHIGTFTPEGTWASAMGMLPELAELGITLLEIMPIAEFPGRFGWGYDGVALFAPYHHYGEPDDLRRFIDRAHAVGVAVILDVVYNHFGPDGNYLKQYSERYFTDRYPNDWGEAIDFESEGSAPVRDFFIANAGLWIEEYHLDGLRLDATQQIYDRSKDNVITAIGRRVREAARGRATVLIAENEPQETKLVRPVSAGGYGLDGLWNDDFHHTALVALTGRREAYYTDYLGTPQELISALDRGYLYQGQRYSWQEKPRGTSTRGLPRSAFIAYLDNHDQVANSGRGWRSNRLTSPGKHRAITALMLLGPATPMLFQGQEFGASSPFLYFADHTPELAKLVRQGRTKFLRQFPSLAGPEVVERLDDPGSARTFERSKLDPDERRTHPEAYALHRDLLALRRREPIFASPAELAGAVIDTEALVLRFFAEKPEGDRLLLLNLGKDLSLTPAPEPLLAPPGGCSWQLELSTEHPRYGGAGTPPVENGLRVPAECALVLRAKVDDERP